MKKWILSWLRKWGIVTTVKDASIPLMSISIKGEPSLTVLNANGKEQNNLVDFGSRRIKLLRPFPKEVLISSPYGERELNGKKEFHNGYDFKTPVGTLVRACHSGAVSRSGYQNELDKGEGFGLRIMEEIEVEDLRFYLFYGHLSKIFVKEGDRVHRGQEIGLTGNTGRTEGPHCHVECRLKDSKDRFEIEWLDA